MKRLPLYRQPHFARRILEVGGGHNPFEGVTHAVDKFPHDNAHRAGDLRMAVGAQFLEGDLEHLPFSSAERFDFIYVSHVFEHVTDAPKAIFEINRVAKRGYLETPSPLREQIASLQEGGDSDYHTQFVWNTHGVVCVIPKKTETLFEFCGCRHGKIAQALCDHARSEPETEAILPGSSKTQSLHFKTPLELKRFSKFQEACSAGYCAYASVQKAELWASWPLRLTAARFTGLARILGKIHASMVL